ncbi:MAG: FAD-dependent oxidoreductase [Streptosporangiales bacterium]|nr:FAD-dependent oxidoreductase [Streptosporangiales bacterium]
MAAVADVVVVGGGVVGASIAFHLARLGAGAVTLLERSERLAAGATGRSGALVRTHYTNEPEAAMAWAAVPWFEEWAERVGGSCGFVQTGFVQLVLPEDNDLLRAHVAMQQRVGIDTRLVDAAELRTLEPALAVRDGELAAYEPRSGYADPVATTEGFAAAAQRHDATVRLDEPVLSLQQQGSRVTGVVTAAGTIAADVVVLANGWWSKAMLADIGVDVPIDPYRAQRTLVERPASLRGERGHLTVIDRRHGIYTRPHGTDSTLVGLSSASQPSPLDSGEASEVDREFPDRARARLAAALPAFADSAVRDSAAGPLDVTPDRCCLLGPVDGVEGLQLAVGMSGGGFKKAPAIGACIAELVVEGRASAAPIEPFDPDRFTRGGAIESTAYRVGGGPEESREALVH